MSMLAEPRKTRQKGSFKTESNPRGDLWLKDDSKLGQKMLENMGWAKGDGLGKNKQGISDALKPSINTGKAGLGLDNTNDLDDWSHHHDKFEDVLANLNSLNSTPGGSDNENEESSKKQKKFSLENSSKESKARVHYHKFLRGKDVSNYKEDDLACVVGSKRLKKRKSKEVSNNEEIEEEPQEESKEPEYISYGGNLQEYFNKKFSELSRKRSEGLLAPVSDSVQENVESNFDIQFTPSRKDFSFSVDCKNNTVVEESVNNVEINEENVNERKSKKKKKQKTLEDSSDHEIVNSKEIKPFHATYNSNDIKPFGGVLKLFKKKSKARLSSVDEINEDIGIRNNNKEEEGVMCNNNSIKDGTKSKKNKKKNMEIESHCDENVIDDLENVNSEKKIKKSKKKKNKNIDIDVENECESPENGDESEREAALPSQDRKKKSKLLNGNGDNKENSKYGVDNVLHDTTKPKKNNKSKKNPIEVEESVDASELPEKKKKKKKLLERCASILEKSSKVDDNALDVNQSYLNATEVGKKGKRKAKELDESEGNVSFNPIKKMKKISSQLSLGELFTGGSDNNAVKKKKKKKRNSLNNIEEMSENNVESEDVVSKVDESDSCQDKGEKKKKRTWVVKAKDTSYVFDLENTFPGSNVFGIKGYPY